jgi:hypothetical protein
MVFNAIFNNISVISWQSVLLVEEIGIPGENHGPVPSHRQTLLHNVITNSIQKRTQLLNVVTRNITVLISGFCSTSISNHQIAEILITGRFVFSLQKIKKHFVFLLDL